MEDEFEDTEEEEEIKCEALQSQAKTFFEKIKGFSDIQNERFSLVDGTENYIKFEFPVLKETQEMTRIKGS